jgi:hypothetical protein
MHREPDPSRPQPSEGDSVTGDGATHHDVTGDGATHHDATSHGEATSAAHPGPRAWHGGSMAYRPDLERDRDDTEQAGDGDSSAAADSQASPHSTPAYPTPAYPAPGYPTTAPATTMAAEPEPSWRTRGLVALAVAAVIAVLGFPLGWLWSSVAPWLPGVVEPDGLFLAQPYGEQRAGAETWYIMLSIGAGIIIAIVAWVALRRFRGPLMVAALAVGGIAASWLAWRFGHNIGRGHAREVAAHGKVGQIVLVPPDLRIKQPGNIAYWHRLPYLSGVLLYLAIAAILVYVLIACFTASPNLVARRLPRPSGDQ